MTTPTPNAVTAGSLILGGAPGDLPARLRLALLRALRTLLQGLAAAFPAAGAGTVVLTTGYWATFGYSCIAAGIAALVSLLHNFAGILPPDPTQRPTT